MGNVIAVGDGAPIIPEAQQRRALRIVNDLNKHVKVMRRFDARINCLQLFTTTVDSMGRILQPSIVRWSDHPQIQLLLQRRDRYVKLGEDAAKFQNIIDGFIPEGEREGFAKMKAIDALSRLEQQRHKELEAMEICLVNVRKDLSTHLYACQKFVTDMAKYVQSERVIQAKLGNNLDDLPDSALDARLADDVAD